MKKIDDFSLVNGSMNVQLANHSVHCKHNETVHVSISIINIIVCKTNVEQSKKTNR